MNDIILGILGLMLSSAMVYHRLVSRREIDKVEAIDLRLKAVEEAVIQLKVSDDMRKDLKDEVSHLSELVTLLRIQLGARNRE